MQAHGREVFNDHDNDPVSSKFYISTKLGEVSQYPEKALTSGPGGGPYWAKIR